MLPATPRLTLREFVEEDAALLHALDAEPEVTRYTLNALRSLEAYLERIAQYRWQYAETGGKLGFFAAFSQAEGDFVGWFHLRPAAAPGDLVLGCRLRRSVWGRDLATEMSPALIRYAFRSSERGTSPRRRLPPTRRPGGSWRNAACPAICGLTTKDRTGHRTLRCSTRSGATRTKYDSVQLLETWYTERKLASYPRERTRYLGPHPCRGTAFSRSPDIMCPACYRRLSTARMSSDAR